MPDSRPLRPGDPEELGGYRLLEILGEGGQGIVYLGRSRGDGAGGDSGEARRDEARPVVAIKLLRTHLSSDPKARRYFGKEVAAAQRIDPSFTARIIEADMDGETPYIVSEYVDGRPLSEAVRANGPMPGPELNRLAIGTLKALVAIHQANVVHRDLKPSNVLLSADRPRVIDFGIARALDATVSVSSGAVGTPAYMAPEQLIGEHITPAVDVFAWGSTMVFAATGAPPFGQTSIPVVMHRILSGDPALGGLQGPLRELVSACLHKDPAQRPTARQALARLDWTAPPGAPGGASSSPYAPAAQGTTDTVFMARPPEEPAFVDAHPLPPGREAHAVAAESPAARSGRTRAVIAPLLLGVLAGIVVITLVIGPRLGGDGADEGPSGIKAPASDDGPVDGVPAAFHGIWRGTAVNQQGARFPVQVTFQSGQNTATVFYPPPTGCNGTLTLTEGTESRLSMALRIGRPCTDGGAVTVTPRADGSLDYAWAKQGTGLHYRATLNTG